MKRKHRMWCVAWTCAASAAAASVSMAALASAPNEVGQLSPLIPFPKDAIYAGVSWTHHSSPQICFGMRPTEYQGHHLTDGLGNLDPTFESLVYGGFGFSTGPHGLDQSVLKGDLARDNAMCWDLTHPDAFNDTGVFSIVDDGGNPLVSKDDFALNADAFINGGHTQGLNYNVFCSGNVALADGRWLFIGGHDKSGNNGIRKLNIYDPISGQWADRGMPQVKADFLADPTGTLFPHADANDELNTDPPHSSDMRYQRWYPTAVTLPNKHVLVISGTDQDTSLGPPGTQFFPPCTSQTQSAACSKIRAATPEVYDPVTDSAFALENARKLFNMYTRSFVVQTGYGLNDWKVAAVGEVNDDFLDPVTGLPPLNVLGQYDPWTYTGRTLFLDVQSAAADPARETPASNHWQHVATALTAHDSGASAQLWELGAHGHAIHQRVALFGGSCGRVPTVSGQPAFACPQDAVEMIDFQDANPQWIAQEPLLQPASQNNAVALPDGKVVVFGGAQGRGPWNNSFTLQMFDPETGSISPLVDTKVPRHDHSAGALLPDGRVVLMGGNATDLANDVSLVDVGIPAAQIYSPAYLFKGARPVITKAPKKISYHSRFTIKVAQHCSSIASVSLVRMGPVTHNWDWGNRHVKLWSKQTNNRNVVVQAPAAPGLAVPGYYMLFVVDKKGVPSVASLVHLD